MTDQTEFFSVWCFNNAVCGRCTVICNSVFVKVKVNSDVMYIRWEIIVIKINLLSFGDWSTNEGLVEWTTQINVQRQWHNVAVSKPNIVISAIPLIQALYVGQIQLIFTFKVFLGFCSENSVFKCVKYKQQSKGKL